MNKKLKDLEKKVREDIALDRYKAACEQIVHAELGIEFLTTQAGKDLEGENAAKNEVLKYEHILCVKKAEKEFLEKKLTA